MALNGTNLINNVTVYLPECAAYVSTSSINYEDAISFEPTTWEYYKEFVPDVLGGIILGGIALILFIVSIVWICVQACRLRKKRKEWRASHPDEPKESFESKTPSVTSLGLPAPRMPRHATIFAVIALLMGLGVIGVSIWGIVESIRGTNTQIPDFWDTTLDVQNRTATISTLLRNVNTSMSTINPGITTMLNVVNQVVELIERETNETISVDSLTDSLEPVQAQIQDVLRAVGSIVRFIDRQIVLRISNLYNDIYSTTDTVQDTWRFVVIIVLFSLTILFTLALLGLISRMRFPKTTSFVTALYWLIVALLMIAGAALLRGVFAVSGDACRYTETYIHNWLQPLVPSAQQSLFNRVWYYYIINGDIGNQTYSDYITGGPISEVMNFVQSDTVVTVLDGLRHLTSSEVQQATGLDNATATNITATVNAVPQLAANLTWLVGNLSRENLQPMYVEIKTTICCSVNNNVWDLWLAWTVAACLCFVFGLLCSVRVISHTLLINRQQDLADAAFITSLPYSAPPPAAARPPATPSWRVGDRGELLSTTTSSRSRPYASVTSADAPNRPLFGSAPDIPEHSAPSAPPVQFSSGTNGAGPRYGGWYNT